MKFTETNLQGCFVIEPNIFEDQRGYFFESYNQKVIDKIMGNKINFVQDNETISKKGVIRGLHFQEEEFSQAKLVRVVEGKILDVAVDIRKNSSTFGQYVTIELSDKNKKQFFIPRGFAHGFLVLSEYAKVLYKCDNFYNKASESGIAFNDKDLNIDWGLKKDKLILSEKDRKLPNFKDLLI